MFAVNRKLFDTKKKVSGPLLDRIDLRVQLKPLSTDERFGDVADGQSGLLRANVERCREIQRQRFAETDIPFNAAIPGGHVRDYCKFSDSGFGQYKSTIEQTSLSTRSMDRLAKVARTIADLAGESNVESQHVKQAGKFVVGGMLRDRF